MSMPAQMGMLAGPKAHTRNGAGTGAYGYREQVKGRGVTQGNLEGKIDNEMQRPVSVSARTCDVTITRCVSNCACTLHCTHVAGL